MTSDIQDLASLTLERFIYHNTVDTFEFYWPIYTPTFLLQYHSLSNSLSVGFGLKSFFYQLWEWENQSIILLWLQIQG